MEAVHGICPGVTGTTLPRLDQANEEIWGLFNLMLPGLVRQDGYDYGAIQAVLDMHGIEQMRRPAILRQCVRLIEVVDAERQKRQAKAGD